MLHNLGFAPVLFSTQTPPVSGAYLPHNFPRQDLASPAVLARLDRGRALFTNDVEEEFSEVHMPNPVYIRSYRP
jgi:hypothetical protein